jgi:carbonic anhydrase
MSQHGKFVTAINCMDGRVQIPVIEWLKNAYDADYVDVVTEPGPNRILAENKDAQATGSIKKRVDISVNKHGSKLVAIVGHHDCAGNPSDRQTQLGHLSEAAKTVKSWGYNVSVIGLWVDEKWTVYKPTQP